MPFNLAVSPPSAQFTQYRVGGKYPFYFTVTNSEPTSVHVRIVPPLNACFKVWEVTQLERTTGKVAPGLSVSYEILFTPEHLEPIHDNIQIQTEKGSTTFQITAQLAPPVLTLPQILDCGPCFNDKSKIIEIKFSNLGGTGTFAFEQPGIESKEVTLATLHIAKSNQNDNTKNKGKSNGVPGSYLNTKYFVIEPKYFHLEKGEEGTVRVTYYPMGVKKTKSRINDESDSDSINVSEDEKGSICSPHEIMVQLNCNDYLILPIYLKGQSIRPFAFIPLPPTTAPLPSLDESQLNILTQPFIFRAPVPPRSLFFTQTPLYTSNTQEILVYNPCPLPIRFNWLFLDAPLDYIRGTDIRMLLYNIATRRRTQTKQINEISNELNDNDNLILEMDSILQEKLIEGLDYLQIEPQNGIINAFTQSKFHITFTPQPPQISNQSISQSNKARSIGGRIGEQGFRTNYDSWMFMYASMSTLPPNGSQSPYSLWDQQITDPSGVRDINKEKGIVSVNDKSQNKNNQQTTSSLLQTEENNQFSLDPNQQEQLIAETTTSSSSQSTSQSSIKSFGRKGENLLFTLPVSGTSSIPDLSLIQQSKLVSIHNSNQLNEGDGNASKSRSIIKYDYPISNEKGTTRSSFGSSALSTALTQLSLIPTDPLHPVCALRIEEPCIDFGVLPPNRFNIMNVTLVNTSPNKRLRYKWRIRIDDEKKRQRLANEKNEVVPIKNSDQYPEPQFIPFVNAVQVIEKVFTPDVVQMILNNNPLELFGLGLQKVQNNQEDDSEEKEQEDNNDDQRQNLVVIRNTAIELYNEIETTNSYSIYREQQSVGLMVVSSPNGVIEPGQSMVLSVGFACVNQHTMDLLSRIVVEEIDSDGKYQETKNKEVEDELIDEEDNQNESNSLVLALSGAVLVPVVAVDPPFLSLEATYVNITSEKKLKLINSTGVPCNFVWETIIMNGQGEAELDVLNENDDEEEDFLNDQDKSSTPQHYIPETPASQMRLKRKRSQQFSLTFNPPTGELGPNKTIDIMMSFTPYTGGPYELAGVCHIADTHNAATGLIIRAFADSLSVNYSVEDPITHEQPNTPINDVYDYQKGKSIIFPDDIPVGSIKHMLVKLINPTTITAYYTLKFIRFHAPANEQELKTMYRQRKKKRNEQIKELSELQPIIERPELLESEQGSRKDQNNPIKSPFETYQGPQDNDDKAGEDEDAAFDVMAPIAIEKKVQPIDESKGIQSGSLIVKNGRVFRTKASIQEEQEPKGEAAKKKKIKQTLNELKKVADASRVNLKVVKVDTSKKVKEKNVSVKTQVSSNQSANSLMTAVDSSQSNQFPKKPQIRGSADEHKSYFVKPSKASSIFLSNQGQEFCEKEIKKQSEIRESQIRLGRGKGIALFPSPSPKGMLLPESVLVIDVALYSNAQGVYRDNLVARFYEVQGHIGKQWKEPEDINERQFNTEEEKQNFIQEQQELKDKKDKYIRDPKNYLIDHIKEAAPPISIPVYAGIVGRELEFDGGPTSLFPERLDGEDQQENEKKNEEQRKELNEQNYDEQMEQQRKIPNPKLSPLPQLSFLPTLRNIGDLTKQIRIANKSCFDILLQWIRYEQPRERPPILQVRIEFGNQQKERNDDINDGSFKGEGNQQQSTKIQQQQSKEPSDKPKVIIDAYHPKEINEDKIMPPFTIFPESTIVKRGSSYNFDLFLHTDSPSLVDGLNTLLLEAKATPIYPRISQIQQVGTLTQQTKQMIPELRQLYDLQGRRLNWYTSELIKEVRSLQLYPIFQDQRSGNIFFLPPTDLSNTKSFSSSFKQSPLPSSTVNSPFPLGQSQPITDGIIPYPKGAINERLNTALAETAQDQSYAQQILNATNRDDATKALSNQLVKRSLQKRYQRMRAVIPPPEQYLRNRAIVAMLKRTSRKHRLSKGDKQQYKQLKGDTQIQFEVDDSPKTADGDVSMNFLINAVAGSKNGARINPFAEEALHSTPPLRFLTTVIVIKPYLTPSVNQMRFILAPPPHPSTPKPKQLVLTNTSQATLSFVAIISPPFVFVVNQFDEDIETLKKTGSKILQQISNVTKRSTSTENLVKKAFTSTTASHEVMDYNQIPPVAKTISRTPLPVVLKGGKPIALTREDIMKSCGLKEDQIINYTKITKSKERDQTIKSSSTDKNNLSPEKLRTPKQQTKPQSPSKQGMKQQQQLNSNKISSKTPNKTPETIERRGLSRNSQLSVSVSQAAFVPLGSSTANAMLNQRIQEMKYSQNTTQSTQLVALSPRENCEISVSIINEAIDNKNGDIREKRGIGSGTVMQGREAKQLALAMKHWQINKRRKEKEIVLASDDYDIDEDIGVDGDGNTGSIGEQDDQIENNDDIYLDFDYDDVESQSANADTKQTKADFNMNKQIGQQQQQQGFEQEQQQQQQGISLGGRRLIRKKPRRRRIEEIILPKEEPQAKYLGFKAEWPEDEEIKGEIAILNISGEEMNTGNDSQKNKDSKDKENNKERVRIGLRGQIRHALLLPQVYLALIQRNQVMIADTTVLRVGKLINSSDDSKTDKNRSKTDRSNSSQNNYKFSNQLIPNPLQQSINHPDTSIMNVDNPQSIPPQPLSPSSQSILSIQPPPFSPYGYFTIDFGTIRINPEYPPVFRYAMLNVSSIDAHYRVTFQALIRSPAVSSVLLQTPGLTIGRAPLALTDSILITPSTLTQYSSISQQQSSSASLPNEKSNQIPQHLNINRSLSILAGSLHPDADAALILQQMKITPISGKGTENETARGPFKLLCGYRGVVPGHKEGMLQSTCLEIEFNPHEVGASAAVLMVEVCGGQKFPLFVHGDATLVE